MREKSEEILYEGVIRPKASLMSDKIANAA